MPYLFASVPSKRTNASGVGARGYHVFRRGRKVGCEWRRVEFRSVIKQMFFWNSAMRKVYRCSSEKSALALLKSIVQMKLAKGYQRLPSGVKIYL